MGEFYQQAEQQVRKPVFTIGELTVGAQLMT
jgi:hypothetical protein